MINNNPAAEGERAGRQDNAITELTKTLNYYKRQQRAMTTRGGDPEAFAALIQKAQSELDTLKAARA